jgi:hypothetical protein
MDAKRRPRRRETHSTLEGSPCLGCSPMILARRWLSSANGSRGLGHAPARGSLFTNFPAFATVEAPFTVIYKDLYEGLGG